MSKYIDATLRFFDKFSAPMKRAADSMTGVSGKIASHNMDMQKFGRQMERTGKKVTKTGTAMTKGLTLPIAGVIGASVKVGMDFDKQMSRVQAISGATGKDFDKLREKAKSLGATSKFSATEVSEGMEYMAMAGWKTNDILSGMPGMLNLAAASGEELATVSDIVTDGMTAFGMKASESGHFADVMAAAATNANTNVGMLGESFKYAAPLAGTLKFSIEDTTTALGLMANAGIKGSSAGTSMRSWLTRMAKPTKESQAAMDKLGLSMTDSHGKMKSLRTIMTETRGAFGKLSKSEQASAAASIAGKAGMSGLLAVVNSSDKDFKKLTGAVDDCNGSAAEMAEQMLNNGAGALTILKSSLESAGIAINDRLAPYIVKIVKWVQKWVDRFNHLSPKTQDIIIKIALLVAVIGPALVIVGKIITAVGTVIKTIGMLGKAFMVLGKAMSFLAANPIILVIMGIAIAALLIIKNWKKIKAFFAPLVNWFKDKLGKIKGFFGAIGDKVTAMKNKMHKGFVNAGRHLVSFANKIGINTGNIKKFFGGITKFLTGVFTGDWKKAWSGIKDIFSSVWSSFKGIVKRPINAIIEMVNTLINGLNKFQISIPDKKWIPAAFRGASFGFNVPTIPLLAQGTKWWKGGTAMINERQGEIVDLPKGSRVYPHDESVRKAREDGRKEAGQTVNKNYSVTMKIERMEVRKENDIEKVARKLAELLENMDAAEVEV